MSVSNITGMADVVRQTRTILADLPAIVDELKNTATAVMVNVATVKGLTGELKTANVELETAIGQIGNGGPPLETTTPSAEPSPDSSVKIGPAVSYP